MPRCLQREGEQDKHSPGPRSAQLNGGCELAGQRYIVASDIVSLCAPFDIHSSAGKRALIPICQCLGPSLLQSEQTFSRRATPAHGLHVVSSSVIVTGDSMAMGQDTGVRPKCR